MRSTMRNQVPKTVKKPSREEGFAIPIALGMGLIMILLATTAIVRSQDDRTTSINQKDTQRSKLAAEAGIAQIQSLINLYRTAARYPACQGSWNSDGSCSDGTTVLSWAASNNLPSNLNASCSAATLSAAQGTVQSWGNASWRDVVAPETETDPTKKKGQFRLVNYKFDNTSTTNQFGELTVEGRVNGGQSNEALTQLKVSFNVFESSQLVAPLWVTGTVAGNPIVNGDVLRPCGSTTEVTFPAGKKHKVLQSQMTFPATITVPASAIPLAKISDLPDNQLPRATDTPDSDGIYKYAVASFDGSFKVPAGARVSLWVTGNLDLSDRIIVNQCAKTATMTEADAEACTPFDVRIYGTSGTLTLNPNTRICDVLFHMPDYDVSSSTTDAANTAQNCGDTLINKKNTGIYWVKSWTSVAGSTGSAIDEPRVKWTNSDVVPLQVAPPPTIGPIKYN
jgi:Tfp pilus assembly protein PilX